MQLRTTGFQLKHEMVTGSNLQDPWADIYLRVWSLRWGWSQYWLWYCKGLCGSIHVELAEDWTVTACVSCPIKCQTLFQQLLHCQTQVFNHYNLTEAMHTFQIHYPSEISLLSIYPTALMVHNTTAPTTYTACGLSLQMGLPYHNQYPLYLFMPLNFWLVDLAAEEMDMNDEHLQVPLVPTHSSHVQCCKLNTSSTTQWHSSTYRLRLWRNKHLRFKSYNKVSKQNCRRMKEHAL